MVRKQFVNMVEKLTIKHLMLITKVIPMVLAFFHFLNCITSYFGINGECLTYISGISIIPVLYLYVASYCFKLCEYYRMFLHYCIIIDIINAYDYYIGIPITDLNILCVYIAITIIVMFIILYLKFFK